jgi:hypothetical protein
VCSVSPETAPTAVDLSLKTQDFVPSLFFLGHFRSDSVSGEEEKSVHRVESFEEVLLSQTAAAGHRRPPPAAACRQPDRRLPPCRTLAGKRPELSLSL